MDRYYNTKDIAEKFDLKYITVCKRFVSKYAYERWGVVEIGKKRYVPESKLHLWEQNMSYVGRPSR